MNAQINQARLESALSTIFPNENVIKNARKEVAIKSPINGEYLEVDLWFPDLKLCFEYQDEYHYHSTWYCHIPLSLVQSRDNLKRNALLQRGETLIRVPCWWDGTVPSLQATINFHRPEFLFSEGAVIPINPSVNFFPVSIVPKSMQLMLPSFPNPHELVSVSNHNAWWLGEKYDGVRCYWNPSEKQLYSRHGLHLGVHALVLNLIGSFVIDGEIWCGRGLFLESQKIVNSTPDRIDWSLLRVISFDEASQQMAARPFENRYALLLSHFSASHPTVIIAARFLCTFPWAITQALQTIVEGGGEGVILRKPQSTYERGRSTSLLKLKATKSDQEALVVNVEADGSLLLQLPDGTTFVAEKEDCVLHKRAVRGDVVTFTYDFATRQSQDVAPRHTNAHDLAPRGTPPRDAETQERSASAQSVPSNPVVFRIRDDLSWDDVLQTSSHPVRQFLNESYNKVETFAARPRGYWMYDKGKNMRSHLEEIARTRGFDPLVAENWYNSSRQDLMQHREVRTLILHFGNSLIRALVDLFPELNLQVSKFATTPMSYWVEAKNRRDLYENFARERGGDPLNPQFWYDLSSKEGLLIKGAASVIPYHSHSVTQALVDLFPEVNFDLRNFYQSPLLELKTRRSFFEKYALENGFDPHNPHNWHTKRLRKLVKHKGTFAVIAYHNHNVTQALRETFPELQWAKN